MSVSIRASTGAFLHNLRGTMSNTLYDHPLYRVKVELMSIDERISLAYARAKLILETYSKWISLSASSVLDCHLSQISLS